MIVTDLFNSNETLTHERWVYRDLSVGFSMLYYVIGGEGYYEEGGKTVRFKEGHLYITPAWKPFSVRDKPNDRMLHTYTHIYTQPEITELVEAEVKENTPLFDAVALWRKYIHTEDKQLLTHIVQLILSSVGSQLVREDNLASRIKELLDRRDHSPLKMGELCRELGYTREHLTRVFSAEYRITPERYMSSERMTYALSLLLEKRTVTDVAALCGYSNPYAFSKAFKRHYGLSPENYLKSISKI